MTMPHGTVPEPFTGVTKPGAQTPPPGPSVTESDRSARHRARSEPSRLSRDELTDEIAQTRAALGETVQALAAKTDVKARLNDKADAMRLRGAALGRRMRLNAQRDEVWWGAAAGAAAGLVVWAIWRGRR